jgi:site-specific DNA-cytosine methylase
MRILVACEFSGIVREEFAKLGHDAWSCDILPTEIPGNHYEGFIQDVLKSHPMWDLIVAHPPCTDLAVSGARWFEQKSKDGSQQTSIDFFLWFTRLDCPRICIENPIGIMSTLYRKPDQIIQPRQFGHGETKATCL